MECTTRKISAVLSTEQATSVVAIQMTVHNLSYDQKASIQVNDQDWYMLSNSTVEVLGSAKKHGGIGGAFSTITIRAPASATPGTNIIRLRFNGTDGISSGYSVLNINFVDLNGKGVIPESSFEPENTLDWKPFYTDTENIAEGKRLFQEEPLYESPLVKTVNPYVHCAGCHFQDGSDLKMLGFSNWSIYTRSLFHGLNEKQARQIYSYIRLLPHKIIARPWYPLFQPGPGMDAKPFHVCGLAQDLMRCWKTMPIY